MHLMNWTRMMLVYVSSDALDYDRKNMVKGHSFWIKLTWQR
jgi:hypothetical protein